MLSLRDGFRLLRIRPPDGLSSLLLRCSRCIRWHASGVWFDQRSRLADALPLPSTVSFTICSLRAIASRVGHGGLGPSEDGRPCIAVESDLSTHQPAFSSSAVPLCRSVPDRRISLRQCAILRLCL